MTTNSDRNLSFEQASKMWPDASKFPDMWAGSTSDVRGPWVAEDQPFPDMEDKFKVELVKQLDEHSAKVGLLGKGAVKADTGKTQWSLLPWDSLEEIVKVMEFGAGKYSPWNWANGDGFKFHRLFNSSMRHFIAWFWKREDNDPETGLSHMAHLGCNVLFLLHYIVNKETFTKVDDRDERLNGR